ncbi:hypothetical protein NDU88_003385 [Pleurodeles waltl]|uniref:Uncharacterized protein n=1 Tax=Pleurodeles waltl TaxID=8319 RepID=A0AAV7T5B0_PLEWA|nr:hypothetical protein NDU88_003385 [Pleurodeles waltl]
MDPPGRARSGALRGNLQAPRAGGPSLEPRACLTPLYGRTEHGADRWPDTKMSDIAMLVIQHLSQNIDQELVGHT